jgi:predicted ATP-grasp superfamily ATP-dependent carboligase
MRVLIYEHLTGGGMGSEELPASLAAEGELLVAAVARDLLAHEGTRVRVTRDPRLGELRVGESAASRLEVRWIHDRLPAHSIVAQSLNGVDAVWPIAPETGRVLERCNRAVLDAGRLLLGCRPEAVRVAASKLATSRTLASFHVATVPTYAVAEEIPPESRRYVVKPDRGAGCVDTWVVEDSAAARVALKQRAGQGFVAQPWIEGEAMSVCLMYTADQVRVLSYNHQQLRTRRGRLALVGLSVGVSAGVACDLTSTAIQVGRAIPGLFGTVGLDYVQTLAGPVVLEVNPRVTTSYCALSEHLGRSPADLLLRTVQGQAVDWTICAGSPVTLTL